MNLVSLGQNSTDMLGLGFSFLTELITSFIFILVIIISTSSKDLNKFAGLIIGATLFLIHLTTMNLTGTSVNPARSLAPALLMIPFDTSAITQV
jgi:aquaporin Z